MKSAISYTSSKRSTHGIDNTWGLAFTSTKQMFRVAMLPQLVGLNWTSTSALDKYIFSIVMSNRLRSC